MWQIEGDEVVAKNEGRRFSELVQFRQSGCQIASIEYDALAGIRAHSGEGVNSAIFFSDFEV